LPSNNPTFLLTGRLLFFFPKKEKEWIYIPQSAAVHMDELQGVRETSQLKSRIRELEQLIQIRDAEFNNFMRSAPWGIYLARCTSKESIAEARVYYVNPVLTNMFNSLDLLNQPILP
jgi:hypothetical protein